ncbi:MAG: hypothetical protein JO159_05560 [Acidobacteria bacterium]|nr:hypothetical protein [Acidobacteriota bacterium]
MMDGISGSPATAWPNLRRLYPVYASLAREFAIDFDRCPALEEENPADGTEAFEQAESWFQDMDQRNKVQHLRHFLQTAPNLSPETVRDVLAHHLRKKSSSADTRDKVDFLLVQQVSQLAPAGQSDCPLSLAEVLTALEPLVGPAESPQPECLSALDDLVREAGATKSLRELFAARVIERGRELKAASADRFYEPATLAAFARFGVLIRRTFFIRMQEELNAILDGLRELEAGGVTTLDCREAQFAIDEPTSRLRMICQSWKVMFHAEYSSGQPLVLLVDLRSAVEAALAKHQPPAEIKAKACAAGAGASPDTASPDFVVSPPEAWSEETGKTPEDENWK